MRLEIFCISMRVRVRALNLYSAASFSVYFGSIEIPATRSVSFVHKCRLKPYCLKKVCYRYNRHLCTAYLAVITYLC